MKDKIKKIFKGKDGKVSHEGHGEESKENVVEGGDFDPTSNTKNKNSP